MPEPDDLRDLADAIARCRDFCDTEQLAPYAVARLNRAIREARKNPPDPDPDRDDALDRLWSAGRDAPFDDHRRRQVLRMLAELEDLVGAVA